MSQHGMVVRGEVEQLLIALQFQDRVPGLRVQILQGAHDNMEQTLEQLSEEGAPSAQAWLQALNQSPL